MIDLYADWAPSYPPRAHNLLMELEEAAMLRLLPAVTGATALDAGCGTGRYSRVLRDAGARKVVALDLSGAMLREFAAAAAHRIHADMRALPFAAESFDVVVSGLAIIDVREPTAVIREWARVAKPGGIVLFSTLHANGAVRGWRRTFVTASGMRELPAHWHTRADYAAACSSAGLRIESVIEPATEDGPVAFVIRADKDLSARLRS